MSTKFKLRGEYHAMGDLWNCPNQQPPAVFVCAGCGKPIFEHDPYLDMGNDQYCQSCTNKRLKFAVKVVE